MRAFDSVYEKVANNEALALQLVDDDGVTSTYVFREFYCSEPGCDCRRVMLEVHDLERRRVVAVINHAFEPPRGGPVPQTFLDPLHPQGEPAEVLFDAFCQVVANDRAYRGRLRGHYKMWKRAVVDPGQPQHDEVRGRRRGDPRSRPGGGQKRAGADRKARAGQRGAAAGPPAAAPAVTGVELIASQASGGDDKLRRRFRRLLEKVERLQRALRTWTQARPDINGEISRYQAAKEQWQGLLREMVQLLDRSYGDASLGKRERKELAEVICGAVSELVGADGDLDGDGALKALYKKYGKADLDDELAATEAEGLEFLRAMMEVTGVDFGDADVSSMEKLGAFVEQRAEEGAPGSAGGRRARPRKSARDTAAAARREDERRQANKAIQDVYRALAMATHPDREPDPAERARKSDLMREINVAYEGRDLLRLLELQLQLERVDATQVEVLAEERLRHYNRILDEQAKQLADELEGLEMAFVLGNGVEPTSGRLRPADVIARIRADTREIAGTVAMLEKDLAAFRDVRRLKAWLRETGQPRRRGARARAGDEIPF